MPLLDHWGRLSPKLAGPAERGTALLPSNPYILMHIPILVLQKHIEHKVARNIFFVIFGANYGKTT